MAKQKQTNLNAKTKEMLRGMGYDVCKVEQPYNPYSKVRKDCFGFGDYLAIRPNREIVLVQSTSKSNLAARRKKIENNGHAHRWLACGGRILLLGWYKDGRHWRTVSEWYYGREVDRPIETVWGLSCDD
jgi:hypothetical protein